MTALSARACVSSSSFSSGSDAEAESEVREVCQLSKRNCELGKSRKLLQTPLQAEPLLDQPALLCNKVCGLRDKLVCRFTQNLTRPDGRGPVHGLLRAEGEIEKARKGVHPDLQLGNLTLRRSRLCLLAGVRDQLQAAREAQVSHHCVHVALEHQQLELFHALREKHQPAPTIERTSRSETDSCNASTAILSIPVSSSLSLKYATIGVRVNGSS